MRRGLLTVTLAALVVAPSLARSGEFTADDVAGLKHILQPKFQVAEVIEAAGLAAEKCPGLHLIEANIEAEFSSAGASEDDIYTPEFEAMSARGKANALEGYSKNPAHWCERMWTFLGPTHPPMIKYTLLKRD
jgi:hypothetical protein